MMAPSRVSILRQTVKLARTFDLPFSETLDRIQFLPISVRKLMLDICQCGFVCGEIIVLLLF